MRGRGGCLLHVGDQETAGRLPHPVVALGELVGSDEPLVGGVVRVFDQYRSVLCEGRALGGLEPEVDDTADDGLLLLPCEEEQMASLHLRLDPVDPLRPLLAERGQVVAPGLLQMVPAAVAVVPEGQQYLRERVRFLHGLHNNVVLAEHLVGVGVIGGQRQMWVAGVEGELLTPVLVVGGGLTGRDAHHRGGVSLGKCQASRARHERWQAEHVPGRRGQRLVVGDDRCNFHHHTSCLIVQIQCKPGYNHTRFLCFSNRSD